MAFPLPPHDGGSAPPHFLEGAVGQPCPALGASAPGLAGPSAQHTTRLVSLCSFLPSGELLPVPLCLLLALSNHRGLFQCCTTLCDALGEGSAHGTWHLARHGVERGTFAGEGLADFLALRSGGGARLSVGCLRSFLAEDPHAPSRPRP